MIEPVDKIVKVLANGQGNMIFDDAETFITPFHQIWRALKEIGSEDKVHSSSKISEIGIIRRFFQLTYFVD
jgi:hypothetical protein